MDIWMVVLRLIHIFSGVLWAGGGFIMTGFIGPTAEALQQDAAQFMQHFNFKRRFSSMMGVFATLTVLSGLAMYYRLFGWFANLNVGSGLALTVGSAAGLVAFFIGLFLMMPNNKRLEALGKEIAASGGPPAPEKLAEMQKVQERIATSGAWDTVLIVIALIGMTLSEYFAI